ncbi:MAG: hypothetical protein ABWZ64_18925 [Xanthobacteraceae bacterium]
MSTGLDYVRIAKGMRAQLALRKRRFEEGAKQAGWKVGLGAPAVMAKLGLRCRSWASCSIARCCR